MFIRSCPYSLQIESDVEFFASVETGGPKFASYVVGDRNVME